MVETVMMLLAAMVFGALVGAVFVHKRPKPKAAPSNKRKEGAVKAAETRRRKALEAQGNALGGNGAVPATDPSLYGRKGNGEAPWAG